jgi:hypothetical protein
MINARRALLGCLFGLSLVACPEAPKMKQDLFNRGEALYLASASDDAAFEKRKRIIDAVDHASTRVWASFKALDSDVIAQALLRAEARGVDVRVVSDVDHSAEKGLVLLRKKLGALANGTARLQLLGGPLSYSPSPNRNLVRGSDINQITDTFFLIDVNRVINVSEGFAAKHGLRWGFDVISMDIAKDFEDEHTQLFGGVSATKLTYFDGQLKSDMNNRVYYPMPNGVWELYFGPQERLMKRVIDELYAARASVQIITPELDNTFMVDALRYKARYGTIVDLLVDESRAGATTSRFNELKKAFAADKSSADLRVGSEIAATIIVIDAEKARDGQQYQTRVLVVSHELVESIPFDANDVSRISDAFMDGNMWAVSRSSSGSSSDVDHALSAFASAFARGKKP